MQVPIEADFSRHQILLDHLFAFWRFWPARHFECFSLSAYTEAQLFLEQTDEDRKKKKTRAREKKSLAITIFAAELNIFSGIPEIYPGRASSVFSEYFFKLIHPKKRNKIKKKTDKKKEISWIILNIWHYLSVKLSSVEKCHLAGRGAEFFQ